VSFRDVIGHRPLVGLLSRSVARESLPPSLIFAGPDGIGKRLVAVATAQALNCVARNKPPDDACGVCATCARIARGVHPDVLIVEPGDSGSMKIDQVREVVDRSGYRPFEGRRRVVILDEADTLVGSAQNALLKTLEEPPPSSIFILVTSRPDALLPTVKSRCVRLRFRALDASEVAAVLVRSGRSEAEARAVAPTADGSVTRALEASAGDLEAAREVAARVLAVAASSKDPRSRLDAAKDLLGPAGAGDRHEVAAELRVMASLVRDVELLAAAEGVSNGRNPVQPAGVTRSGETRLPATPLANPDARPALERLGAYRGVRGIRAYEAIDRALDALDRNAGVKVVADWLVLQL
jgi:DNA polymerase III subunit delta'